MQTLENVLLPAIDERLGLDSAAKVVVIGHISKFDDNITAGFAIECDFTVSELLPLLELPLHLDLLVFFQSNVLRLDSVTEELVLASDLQLRNAGRLRELAQHGLISERFVNNGGWAVVGNLDFSLLRHRV